MKITLDFKEKEISIHSKSTIKEVIEYLDKVLPSKEWLDWKIQSPDIFDYYLDTSKLPSYNTDVTCS